MSINLPLNTPCTGCGKQTETMYEIEGYVGISIWCEECFGGEEPKDGDDADWIDDA